MDEPVLNPSFCAGSPLLFAGDYEVVGPDPRLGHREVAGLGVDMIFIHYHHRHEFEGGHPRGLWGSICPDGGRPDWSELDSVVRSAKRHFSKIALYPVGWAHMVPQCLGETVLDVDPEVIADWVLMVVERYGRDVDLFPIFYELNVFDLFFQATHGQPYGQRQREHIIECLTCCAEKVESRLGQHALAKLTAATFVELTQSSFYWMSEGKLLELPRGSTLVDGPLSPPDLVTLADQMDTAGRVRHGRAVRQLLHTLVFWNADDSGAANFVGDDIRRLVSANVIYDREENPRGFIHTLLPGWDAQPQNTYEYLLSRMVPEMKVPSPSDCLELHYGSFESVMKSDDLPSWVKTRIVGFVLDDVFKCRKQSGVTSAVVPTESVFGELRTASEPAYVTPIGDRYAQLINYQRDALAEPIIRKERIGK